MFELGEYAFAILFAYGGTLLLLALLIFISVRAEAQARADLDDQEGRERDG